MAQKKHKTVGILGGMGPEATVTLMQRVIELTPASDDADHIRMLVDNNPKVPSRIKALIEGTGESPLPVLIQMAQGLEKAGADFLVMPCHTAHHYHSRIVEAVSIPFINLVDLSLDAIKARLPNIKTIGLLASTAVINIQLYENAATNYGIGIINPQKDDQDQLMQIIRSIKGNTHNQQSAKELNRIAKSLKTDCLLVACTELSILSDELHFTRPIFDGLDLLAAETIRQASA
ncbi:MAG: aspartate/glutamate racemase family protein [Gammaproteobacteria bacterium]|nr:aspartate/glutamate racemase family protein [Gammaproteobacteria bacterium]